MCIYIYIHQRSSEPCTVPASGSRSSKVMLLGASSASSDVVDTLRQTGGNFWGVKVGTSKIGRLFILNSADMHKKVLHSNGLKSSRCTKKIH